VRETEGRKSWNREVEENSERNKDKEKERQRK
jgi:hypothetical protein